MIALTGKDSYAVRGDTLLPWTPFGYGPQRDRLRGLEVDVLTPPAMLRALSRGYRPRWHDTSATPLRVPAH